MAQVTVRFFKIEKVHHSAPDLDVALQGAFNSGATASKRERSVAGHILRLERLSKDNTFYDGEIVRKQTGDIPPEANENGLQRLSVSEGGGLGHCIAFRYSVALQTVAIQFDNRAVSINRLLLYLYQFDPTYDYRAEPMVREDSWEKYNRGLPTKFAITIAQPQDLARVEGDVGSAVESVRRLSEMADAPVITIEIKMGRQKGSLTKDTIDGFLKYFTKGKGSSEDIRKLTATSVNEDGPEAINFLKDFLRESRDVEVPEGNPNGHYEKRKAWVKTSFSMHVGYIRAVYGGSGVFED